MTQIKICGLKDGENLRAALDAGAHYVGFVFYKDSPRHIAPRNAWELAREIPPHVKIVGLFVNPSDKDLREALSIVRLDILQLHGDETPLRIVEIKAAYNNIPVMKAVRIGDAGDLAQIERYEKSADWLLFDTKAPPTLALPPIVGGEGWEGGTLYGGSGKSFDWKLLQHRKFAKPWMLSGGLNAANVSHALGILHPTAVDVSSGVEKERGVKDPQKIKDFVKAVQNA